MLTPDQLNEIRERCEKATEGPWNVTGESALTAPGYKEFAPSDEDLDFIANSRTDIPALLAHIAEQDSRIERLEEVAKETMRRFDNGDEAEALEFDFEPLRSELEGKYE